MNLFLKCLQMLRSFNFQVLLNNVQTKMWKLCDYPKWHERVTHPNLQLIKGLLSNPIQKNESEHNIQENLVGQLQHVGC